jgi:hypothetical protein
MKKASIPTNEIPGKRLTMLERLGISDFKDSILNSDGSGSYFHLSKIRQLGASIVGDPAKFREYFLNWVAAGQLLNASFPKRLSSLINGVYLLAAVARDENPFDSFDFNSYAKLQWESSLAGRSGIAVTQEEYDKCVANSYFPLLW